MKRLIISFSFLLLACTSATSQKITNGLNFDSDFSLYQDTIFVDVKGDVTHAIKYHNKFYVLFEQRGLKYGDYGKRWLCVFSNGNIEKTMNLPKNLKVKHLDFFQKNDSIILKPYMEEQCYYFNVQNHIWEKIDKVNDLIFEDEKFYVYSLNFGEWGGKTWFKDKKTGIEYAIGSTTPLVNKIDTTYYLTNSYEILRVKNPMTLNRCDGDATYESTKKNNKYYSWCGEPTGFEIMFPGQTFNYYDFPDKPHNIITSFVWQNELFHIYETDVATYIAKIANNSINTIQKIGGKLNFYEGYYSYRCKNLNKNNELVKFQTQDGQLFGLMEIIDNKIFFHYFIKGRKTN